jgi:DNA-directed RNA polymerase beta' subunit
MLKALSINDFIKREKLLRVSNVSSFNKEGPTVDGLYSKRIFGETLKETKETFGYISLGTVVMHPVHFKTIQNIDPIFRQVLNAGKVDKKKVIPQKFIIKNGTIEKADDGSFGVTWLFSIWDKIIFKNYLNEKNKQYIEFYSTVSKSDVFIDKYIVIPTAFRPPVEKGNIQIEDDITMLYKKLLQISVSSSQDSSTSEFIKKMSDKSSIAELTQRTVNEIYKIFIIDELKGKEGKFRAQLISKRLDNVARLVANARPDIPLNVCVIPWHVLLNLFDIYIVSATTRHFKDYTEEFQEAIEKLGIQSKTPTELGEMFTYIYKNVDTYTKMNPTYREKWIFILTEMFEHLPELSVMVKRDPAWSKESYMELKPAINNENEFNILVSSPLYVPLGGDSFNTNYTTMDVKNGHLFTKKNISIFTDKTNNGEHRISRKIKSLNTIIKDIRQ